MAKHRYIHIFSWIVFAGLLSGCAFDRVKTEDPILPYQKVMAEKGPQERVVDEDLESEVPVGDPGLPALEVVGDTVSGRQAVRLPLENAIALVMSNSPEIRIVSIDPSIARNEITRAVSGFDVNFFSKLQYDKQDSPTDSIFLGGQTESRQFESGFKQRTVLGSEWQLTYALSKNWDDLVTRNLATKFEPMLFFEIKQPLLQDAWPKVNLAGVNVSRLNYRIALAGFRQKTEEILTEVVSLYWTLYQSRHEYEVQQKLLDKTVETVKKLEARRNIDATALQVKQAEVSLKSRQAALLQVRKRLEDVQDALVRLLSSYQMNLLSGLEIIPDTPPNMKAPELDSMAVIALALANNPEIQRSRLSVEVAEINVQLAKRQKMPRLDLVATTRVQGLAGTSAEAHEVLGDADYTSYVVGVTFEYPLGNRQHKAEYSQRRLEHSKAVSSLQNVSDQVTTQVKERVRLAEQAYEEIRIQREAADAAEIHLQALEDMETIREKLTPEFLLVKLQAQESLANARREEIQAMVDYNNALISLAQATGTVLDLGYVQTQLQSVSSPGK